jgi:hypothetical protein
MSLVNLVFKSQEWLLGPIWKQRTRYALAKYWPVLSDWKLLGRSPDQMAAFQCSIELIIMENWLSSGEMSQSANTAASSSRS